MGYTQLQLFINRSQEINLLEDCIKRYAHPGYPLAILEAGCGRRWPLNLGELHYTLTGVDINEDALEIRKNKSKDLDEVVLGDLRYVELEKEKYDVIFCSFVLEHVENAERVLENFCRWLKPGGLLILRIPDRDSVRGLITRITPFQFHVFYYKLVGIKNAGQPGHGPFPTPFNKVVSRKGIHQYCQKHDLIVKEEYGDGYYLNKRGIITFLERCFIRTIGVLSLGRISSESQ